MTVIDPAELDRVRAMPCCWCGRRPPSHAHHLKSRGMGGWGRVDVACNLAALCAACHTAHHAGSRPLYCDLLALVAAREGLLQSEVEAAVACLRRTPGKKPRKVRRPVLPACDRPTCAHCGRRVSGKAYRHPKGVVHGRCLKAMFANQRTED